MDRRTFLTLTAGAAAVAGSAGAHHGLMLWDEENLVVIEGFVAEELDGFPHWEIEVRVNEDSDDWVIDMGDDFIMERAGLNKDGREFTIGKPIKVEGYQPKDSDTHLLRPVRITMDGIVYQFPNSDAFPKD